MIDALVIVGLLAFALHYLTAFRLVTLFTVEARQADFHMWYMFPPLILRHAHYPSAMSGDWQVNFPYLPSAVAMMLPLNALSKPVAFGLWLILQATSFAVVLWAALRLAGAAQWRSRLLIAAGAVVLAGSPIGWDFRTHNNNLIYLALIMLGLVARRTWLAGTLLAASFNLKLYSGALLLGLIWRREYRLAVAMAVASLLLGVVVPIAVFGPSEYLQLLGDWIGEIRYTVSPAGAAAGHASLRHAAAALLGADGSAHGVTVLLRTSQAVWVALVIGYFVVVPRSDGADQRARLADICVLLMAPLPLSTWFLPYHAVVLLPAFVLLLTVAVSDEWPLPVRVAAVAAPALHELLRFALRAWEFRGAVYLLSFVAVLLALGAVRLAHRMRRTPAPDAAAEALGSTAG